jgi:hypothetical protein
MRPLALVLCCLVATPAAAKDIVVTATPLLLNPADSKQTTIDSLEYVAGLALDSTASEWGGYSGMVLAPDGGSLVAVSDVGHWLELELTHDPDGKLTGVGAARIAPLQDEAGKPVNGKEWSDAEEVALTPDGHLLVSFERRHRIWRYTAAADGRAQSTAAPEAITSLPENAGIEGMAAEDGGMLLLIAEGGADTAKGSRSWIGKDKEWSEIFVERSDGFEPTAVARSDGDKLLLLERRYTKADGPAARVSVLATPLPSPRIAGYTLATLRLPLSVDNFEALASRRAPSGGSYIYLLSDDNQSDTQRTLLLQFRVQLE